VNLDSIPDAPAAVLGVMNLRGKVVPVMDVRAHVSGQPTHGRAYQHLVVVQAGTKQVGLVVDDVHEVLEVAELDIEKPGDLAGVKSPGVVRVENDMVLVISPEDVIHGVG
jgi:purine-binding chemotaxis protein CheW